MLLPRPFPDQQGIQTATAPSEQPHRFDAARALRMAGWGLLFYGPYQQWWYRLLERRLPGRSPVNFLSKARRIAHETPRLLALTLTKVRRWP